MATRTQAISASYRDAKGFVGVTRAYLTYDPAVPADAITVADTWVAAISGLTNAAFQSSGGFAADQGVQALAYGANSEYPAEWMRAHMMFLDSKGARHLYRIPAPKIAIFDTDGVTVLNDGTQALVVAYVAAVKTAVSAAFISSRSGLALASFVGGLLKFGKQPRRFNEMIKSSHLVAGEGE